MTDDGICGVKKMQSSIEAVAATAQDDRGIWPTKQSKILDWLMNDVREQRFIDNILVELCEKMRAVGIPIGRATMHFRTMHPQWLGARILWRTGMKEADIATFSYGVENTPQFLASPINEIFNGATEVRKNLEVCQKVDLNYPLYKEMYAEGLTDYIAWPIYHTLGKRHIVTFASDAPGGFTEQHLAFLRDLLPALTMVTEIRLKNIMARTLLRTYVGPHASEKILAGATTRGSGTTVGAAILICDLRDFTTISDMWPRDDVIELLNGYFDAMVDPIEKHGGEILKFMGDGLLAIFPLSDPNACHNLLVAISEAQAGVAALNEENPKLGREGLRLDFTVIGPAVNIASRLESLTKEVKRPVLLSKAFVDMAGCQRDMESLGSFPLKGLGEPVDVFAFAAREKLLQHG